MAPGAFTGEVAAQWTLADLHNPTEGGDAISCGSYPLYH